jgi:hypothetical protein
VLEVVADAPFLAQAAEEVEVALVELGLVVAHRVGLDQSLVDGKRVVRQQFIEDLHDVWFWKILQSVVSVARCSQGRSVSLY